MRAAMIAVLTLAVAGGEGARPAVRTHQDAPPAVAHLRPGLRTLLRALAVGCIHGTECAGMAVARRVLRGRTGCPPDGADIWTLPDLDPDGRATGPETRTARAVVRALRPRLTVWFHQQALPLVRAWGPSVPAARRYARLVGLRFRRVPWAAGTAPHWQNTAFAGTAWFVVELAPGPLSAADARRHTHAIQVLAGVA